MTTAKEYSRIKLRLSLIGFGMTLIFLALVFVTGLSHLFIQWASLFSSNLFVWIPFYLLLLGIVEYVVDFPLHYYSSFYLEHRYQLSNQTLTAWLWRDLKQALIGFAFAIPLMEGFYFLLRYGSDYWWSFAALGWTLITMLLARILPTWIIPLFYRVKPLSNELLNQRLQQLCKQAEMPVRAIYELGLSRDTKKANAALVGWGRSRRVLLGDTLVTQFSPEETAAVLAHELGHHHYRHIWKLVVVSALTGLFGFFLIDKVIVLTIQHQFLISYDDLAGFPLIAFFITIFSFLMLPLQNGYSRRLERQADRFAIELTQDRTHFISSMEKLAEQNLSDKNPHPLVEFFFYDHPAIGKRIEMAKNDQLPNRPQPPAAEGCHRS